MKLKTTPRKIPTIQAGTPTLQTYFSEWATLEQRRENARANNDLSDSGKLKIYQSVTESQAVLRDEAYDGFVSEYAKQRAAMEANGRARGKALENGLARWEPLRNAIDLETERVTRLLKNGASLFDLTLDWNENKDSGALVIAWRRAMGSFTNYTTSLLFTEVKQTYEQFRETPELQRVNARGVELADAAFALKNDTIKFMELLSKVADVSGVNVKFQNLMQQIKLTPLPDGGMYIEFVDSPADAMKKNMQPETFIIQ